MAWIGRRSRDQSEGSRVQSCGTFARGAARRGAARCASKRERVCRASAYSRHGYTYVRISAPPLRRRCPGTPLWSVATAARRGSRVCATGPRAITVCDIHVRARSQRQLVAASDNIYFRYDPEGTEGERERDRAGEKETEGARSPNCCNANCGVSVDARSRQLA